MKFRKFSKALLMGALSAGVVLGVTSCVQSYSVGFLYVTGTVTSGTSASQSSGNGIISGYKIDHNTGKLTSIAGLPVSSGGANPDRAVMLSGGRFLYVLNRGTNAEGGSECTTADPCSNSNITQFAVGGNGILTAQETFYTQGINPFRIFADASGNYLYVLDHDSPVTLSNKAIRSEERRVGKEC
jgi:6-phosphogluconolactonase (cycloisomerase 2 family)